MCCVRVHLLQIKKQQQFVAQILQNLKIDFETVDITDPSNEEAKMFMREHSIPKEGQKIPLPPQIFNDSHYCGVVHSQLYCL